MLALVGGLSGNYLGSGTKECTVTGGYTTISNKRGSGMEDEGRTIETEQCGELRWGARDVGSDGMTAAELDAKHPELVQGETYVFHMCVPHAGFSRPRPRQAQHRGRRGGVNRAEAVDRAECAHGR